MNRPDLSSEVGAAGLLRTPALRRRALLRMTVTAVRQSRAAWLCLCLGLLPLALGCKLLVIKMPGEPMPKADYDLRVDTREFAKVLSATVQHVADTIAVQTNDPAIRTHSLQWKIGAVGAVRSASLHAAPKLALLDSWAFCRQMSQFLDQGAGSNLFGPFQSMAVTNSQSLEQRLSRTARDRLGESDFAEMETFVGEYAAEFPLKTIAFDREPVGPRWDKALKKPFGIPPVGTGSEALSDMADRVQMIGEDVPEQIRWRMTLEGDTLQEEWARTGVTLDRLDGTLKQIGEAAAASPAVATNAVAELRTSFVPVLEKFQTQWETTTKVLQSERQALTESISKERAAVLADVAQQRAALMKETHEMLADVTDRTMKRLHETIRDMVIGVVLLAAIILGLPFGFGYVVGRVTTRAKRAPTPPNP